MKLQQIENYTIPEFIDFSEKFLDRYKKQGFEISRKGLYKLLNYFIDIINKTFDNIDIKLLKSLHKDEEFLNKFSSEENTLKYGFDFTEKEYAKICVKEIVFSVNKTIGFKFIEDKKD